MTYVYSTATCDTAYGIWIKDGNELPIRIRSIVIKGGTGVANKNLFTSYGAVTKVSEEDLTLLEKDEAFQRHIERGFIRVERAKTAPEKVAADMTGRDKSSPLVPQDLPEKKRPKTKVE